MEFFNNEPTGATFSPCRQYRYCLWRRWEPDCQPSQMVAFCGLNPSKAAEVDNDATVKRWIAFAKSWKFGGMFVVNAFGLAETDRTLMLKHSSPIGSENDAAISAVSAVAGKFVCCWGADGGHKNRSSMVRHLLRNRELFYLRLTKHKQPEHPLYLPGDLVPLLWERD